MPDGGDPVNRGPIASAVAAAVDLRIQVRFGDLLQGRFGRGGVVPSQRLPGVVDRLLEVRVLSGRDHRSELLKCLFGLPRVALLQRLARHLELLAHLILGHDEVGGPRLRARRLTGPPIRLPLGAGLPSGVRLPLRALHPLHAGA
jgi:hypothetical protein